MYIIINIIFSYQPPSCKYTRKLIVSYYVIIEMLIDVITSNNCMFVYNRCRQRCSNASFMFFAGKLIVNVGNW